jgi:hypothetical protein
MGADKAIRSDVAGIEQVAETTSPVEYYHLDFLFCSYSYAINLQFNLCDIGYGNPISR